MSYILDALKRADAERERGAVPGLHAQPAALPLPDEAGSTPLPPWAWGLGGLGFALLGMVAWSLWRDDPAPPVPASPQPQAIAPAQTPPAPAGLLPPQQADRLPQGEARPVVRDQAPAPQARSPQPSDTPEQAPADARRPRQEAAQPAREPAAAVTSRTTTRSAGPSETQAPAASGSTPADITALPTSRLLAQHELPDHVRRQLPNLVIGGAMYSENPANRMLVINSQLFHEGDKLGQDLTLEEIKLKSAVLRYKTWRYSVSY